jgi:AhpD family alkylhydroperoxidase
MRLDYFKVVPEAREALLGVERVVEETSLEPLLLELVKLRASQLNGCAFCVDMHTKDARALGEDEQRLHLVVVWREAGCFSARERAALAWTEVLTRLPHAGVSDSVYGEIRAVFSEREIVGLTLAIGLINVWNRLNVAFVRPAGEYVSARHMAHA